MSTNVTKGFADKLSDLIQESKEKGQGLHALSRELGISSGALSNYQNDAATANINALAQIAAHYQVSADWLLGLSKARSISKDIQMASKTTGLSQEAIETIAHLSDEQTAFLDLILTDDKFQSLMEWIRFAPAQN